MFSLPLALGLFHLPSSDLGFCHPSYLLLPPHADMCRSQSRVWFQNILRLSVGMCLKLGPKLPCADPPHWPLLFMTQSAQRRHCIKLTADLYNTHILLHSPCSPKDQVKTFSGPHFTAVKAEALWDTPGLVGGGEMGSLPSWSL